MRFMIFILNCLSPPISNSIVLRVTFSQCPTFLVYGQLSFSLIPRIQSVLSPADFTSCPSISTSTATALALALPSLTWPLQSSLAHPPQPYSLPQPHSPTHSPHCRQHHESTIWICPCSFLPHILIFGHTRLVINHLTPTLRTLLCCVRGACAFALAYPLPRHS